MNAKARKLLDDASHLAPTDRAELAAEILATMDGPADDDAEVAWGREIERRLTKLRNGESRTLPWSKVRADVLRRLRKSR